MHYITFLYLLISLCAAAGAAAAAAAYPSLPDDRFPSLPAAALRVDSADRFAWTWKKSLGAALTGHPFYNPNKKHLRGAKGKGKYHELVMDKPPNYINDPTAMGINEAIRRGLHM